MTTQLSAEIESTYENISAACPHCGVRSVYNRASDLTTFDPVASMVVKCLSPSCAGPFNILGDSIDPAYKMILFDCREFLAQKRYMQCTLNVAQAYEMFFGYFIYVELISRPFAHDGKVDDDRRDRVATLLYKKLEKFAFAAMRSIFLNLVVARAPTRTLADAERIIVAWPSNANKIATVSMADIAGVADIKLRALLLRLRKTTINVLRNHVVHKSAYRPTQQEARDALDEAYDIILGLTGHLRPRWDEDSKSGSTLLAVHSRATVAAKRSRFNARNFSRRPGQRCLAAFAEDRAACERAGCGQRPDRLKRSIRSQC